MKNKIDEILLADDTVDCQDVRNRIFKIIINDERWPKFPKEACELALAEILGIKNEKEKI